MLIKKYVTYSNGINEMKRKIVKKCSSQSGADHGSNFVLGLGIAVLIVAILVGAVNNWLPDAFQKVADKALDVIGIN